MNTRFNTPENDGIKLVYTRSQTGGQLGKIQNITVAYRYDDAGQRIVFAKAFQSKKDQHNRKIGRAVAAGRLNGNSNVESIPYSFFGNDLTYRMIAGTFIGGTF